MAPQDRVIQYGRTTIDLDLLERVLRERREKKGLSVRDVARAAGVAPMTVTNFEKGAYRIQLDKLLAILAVLDLSPTEVLIIDGGAQEPAPDVYELEVARLLREGDYAALFQALADRMGSK